MSGAEWGAAGETKTLHWIEVSAGNGVWEAVSEATPSVIIAEMQMEHRKKSYPNNRLRMVRLTGAIEVKED